MVAEKFYNYSDSKIAGFGRPDWYKYETDTPDTPISNTYKVNTITDPLRLREKPSLTAPIICLMKKGSIVTLIEDCGLWYKVKYRSMVGYAYKEYLVKV